MSNITFYLKNDPEFKGKPRVREYFEQYIGHDNKGVSQYKVGHVDDAVRAQNKDEYSVFKNYVEANHSKVFSECEQKGVAKFNYKASPTPKVEEKVEVKEGKKK